MYDNLINSGKVSEAEIGNRDEFKAAISDEAKTRQFYKNIIGSRLLTEDEIGSEDDFYGSISDDFSTPQQQSPASGGGYQPSAEEMKGFLGTIGGARQTVGQSRQAVNRIGNMQQRAGLDLSQDGRIELGKNRKVTKGQERLNLETGKMESTYVTEAGNEYGNRELADIEQNATDLNRYLESVPGQLEQAYKERDRLNQMAEARRKQIEDERSDEGFVSRLLREAGRAAQSDKIPDNTSPSRDWENDREYSDIMAAIRKNNELITTLEDQRDNATNGFWHSFGTEIANGYTFSLGGKARMDDAIALGDAQKHIDSINKKRSNGEELTHEEEVAEAVLKNAAWDQEVQAKYGDDYGAWARAGKMGANSADFMLDFLMMGGMPAGMAKNIMGAVVKGGERYLGNLATKGFGKFMLKATGATLGSMVAGAEITNTIQLGKTASDVAQSMEGDVYKDEKGNYVFGHYEEDENGEPKFVKGGNDFFEALAQAQRSGISENGSEILGTFLPGGNRIIEALGLSKISRGLTALKGKGWYQNYSKFLETAGFNGVVGEGLEEYGGTAIDALLGGDEWKNLADPRTHIDIWLGVTTMSGILNAPNLIGTGYSAIQYQRYKKATNNADAVASTTMNPDTWNSLRETIDNTDNANMADVAMSILNNDDLSDEGKRAAMNYIGSLQKMRGYSLGSIAAGKDGGESDASREVDEAYTSGYDTQEPDMLKQFKDEAQQSADNLPQFGEEFAKMVTGSQDPVATLNDIMGKRDIYSDEQIAAAADYFQKMSRVNGAMEGALDRIDTEVERMKAEARADTHQQTGNIVMAKGADNTDYYIIGGDIVTDPDTGITSLAGTGGAVVVKDAITGEISVKSPQEVTVYSMIPAEDHMNYIDTEVRNSLMQQADDDFTFGSPANEVYQLEDTVTLLDGDGNVIEGEIGMMPNAVDGVYVVYTPDGKALQYTADQMNRMIVNHNGMEVQRSGAQPEAQTVEAGSNQIQPQPQPQQGGEQTGGEASAEDGTGANEQPVSALSRIPVLTDEKGKPVLDRNGKPKYLWHKASVEDAAAALVETTGGDMVMARDTASDLVKNAQAGLEKIRKQKPKGEDPIEIAESRMEIKRQEQEQQAVIKQWQDVNQAIQKQMRDEAAARQAEIEAAKSAEQKAREAEEARIRKEKQDEQDRQRLREAIERDREKRNKEYDPLVKAREEMKDDTDAQAILADTEPRSLEEWVSSMIRPHSMLWQDASDSETGLQSELGLTRGDMQRMMSLLGTKESGAKPFGKVVLDIYEGLPDAMKDMYTDEDVRRTLLDLFNEGSSTRMMHLTEEHRIEEAREMAKENARRNAEAEMDAWAEAYHLTPEERETFEEFMAAEPEYIEEEIINQIIADNEQNTRGMGLDMQPESRAVQTSIEGGEGQVFEATEAAGNGNTEETPGSDEEAVTGQPAPADNNVPGGESIFVTPVLNVSLSRRLVNDLADAYASGDPSAIRSAAVAMKAYVDEGGDFENKESDDYFDYDGDDPQSLALQYKHRILLDRYLDEDEDQEYIKTGLKPGMRQIAPSEQLKPVDLRDNIKPDSAKPGESKAEKWALSEKRARNGEQFYQTADGNIDLVDIPQKVFDKINYTKAPFRLTESMAKHVYEQHAKELHLNSIDDAIDFVIDVMTNFDHVRLGDNGSLIFSVENGRNTTGKRAITILLSSDSGDYYGIKTSGFEALSKLKKRPLLWDGSAETPTTDTATEPVTSRDAQQGGEQSGSASGQSGLSDGKDTNNSSNNQEKKQESSQEPQNISKRPGTDTPEGEILVKGGTILKNNMAGGDAVALILGSNIDKKTGKRRYTVEYYVNEQDAKERSVAIGDAEIGQDEMRQHLSNGDFSKERKAEKPAQPKKKEPKRLVSDEKMEELRKKLLDKLNNLNAGIDPEMMLLGAMYAVGNIERGVTKFADYARAMIDGLNDKIRPYLKSFYNAVRDMPEAAEYASQMDDYDTVARFDVYNFDKPVTPNIITRAEQIVTEQKIRKQAQKIQAEQPDMFAGDLFGTQEETVPAPQAKVNTEPILRPANEADLDSADAKWYHNGKRVYILAITRRGEQVNATQFSKPIVESVMLNNGKSVKLEDLMVEDKSAIGTTSSPEQIASEEGKVDTNPSEAQKEAGNYQKGHIKIDGYDITIENPKGSIRRGTDANGKPWETEMHNTYGYIRGTEGVDGDHIDVFLSDNPTSGKVYVVDQVNPGTKEFDEHKVMYGFGSEEEAREAYLANYSKGWKGLGNITEVSREDFKKWVESSHRKTKPFAEYKSVVKSQKKKSDWWNDPNRPQSIDPKDYRTYMTPEAKDYFAKFKGGNTDFTTWAHPNLAYITAAVWDEVEIPYDELKKVPEIIEAENTIKTAESKGKLVISEDEANSLAQRLIDREKARQERKALVIIGLPAGGKSSVFTNPLSKEFGARIIDSDDVNPWLDGFDGGNGAGYVQDASAEVAEKAIDIAVKNGDNIIIPRIGGKSVMELSAALRLAGYDVQLYFNDVKGVTSIDRAASRFAQTGRYLSLDYLTKKAGVPSENFSKFAEKTLGGYLDEQTERELQNIRGRLQGLLGELDSEGEGLRLLRYAERRGQGTAEGEIQDALGSRGLSDEGGDISGLLDSPLFNYSEWKSNDVAFGEKPKEIWNSESGKPMPGKKEEKNNEAESKVSRKPEPTGKGTGQASGSVGRTGTEPGPESDRPERTGSGHSIENTLGVPDGGEARDSSEGPAGNSTSGITRDTAGALPKHNNRRNNVGERGKDYAPLSPKARFNANVEAIKMMRALIDNSIEAPTTDQMEVLRKYSGWGGMGTFFNDGTTPEYRQLHDLLSEEELNDAAMSINSAYYTPAMVIDSLWDIAKAMGFKGGNVLEGSAGIGNIIGQMPKDMSRRSNIEAVEIDSISGNILKLLYPDAKVHIQGFQDTMIPNGTVDLAVTNVPFVTGLHVIDKVDKDLSRKFTNIHDFCIAKNIRKLHEGGIGIFITSAGTMDKSTKLREWIPDEGQADVVGAFRLNNKTFGGTTVTSDIIVVRKRVNGQKSPNAIDISKASPLRVGTWTDKYGDEHQVSMVVNDYFRDHPEMMAGKMAFGYEKGDTFRPGSYGLYPVESMDQEKMLADFAKSMEKARETRDVREIRSVKEEQAQNQLTAEKEGRMLVDDKGRLCVSERGVAVPLGLNDQKVKGYTKAECFADYQAVQKAVDDVLQQQLGDPDDAALKPKLDALNKAYDKFTKRYGTLHKNTSISFLRNDIDFPSFLALENYSETKDMKGKVTVKTSKAPLFSQRVLGFKTEPKPKSIKDALIASIFRTNGIDLGWITEKLNESGVKPPHKDQWDEEDVRKGILVSRLGFEDPSTGQLEIRYKYLSGNVREKLSIAESYNTDGRYAANVEELRKAVPMDIPSHLIDFSIGSSWIPIELYKDYLKDKYDLDNVKLNHVEGTWVLDEGYGFRNEKNRSAGVYSEQFRETIYGHQLVAAALNNRPVKVSKQVSEGWGSSKTTRTVVDQAATQACAVRVDEIKDEFKQWAKKRMQDDPELAKRIEKIYNDKFNALVPMQIDDEFLPEKFDGANVNVSLYDHQKRGVMRGLTSPTMLAHEVGTGKSFTLISTAMEMRRLGTAKKPMIVVQNATVAQMTADAKFLYPNAKVLSLSEKDRSAEGRRAFYAKIKFNDWDLVIVPQSTFERIPDSPERELQFIQEKIDEKKHVIEAAQAAGVDSREIERLKKELQKIEEEYGDTYLDHDPMNNGQERARSGKSGKKKDAKREAASLDKAETKAKEMLDRAVDDVQYFDDLGVDALLVDEAHEYKHLGFQTSIGRGIKGIDPSYSKKCAGLYNKTRSVFEKSGWKNVVFATGTPISNTAAEIWTFMKYLMPADVMRQNDIYYFDDFVHNFGSISQMLEFSTSGKFKENTRFAAYVNKPELIRIWSQVADTVLTREVGAVKSKVPEKEGGKDQDVFLPQSPSLISIMAAVRAELERFENMTGKEKKENSSIPLTMYGIAKRAAIDPRLVNADAPDEPLSKTNAAVKEIVKDLKATQDYKGTVAVFCDNQNRKGTDGSVEFNIYDDMREKLIAQGVPADQIAIIRSGMSIAAKQKVFDAVNSGTIRVVLGSTQTLGTGVNMQERLHLLIHMDAPDRPMDYTQRNGRIERQGNLHKIWNKPIRIVRFGVEDSLDVTAYQRLKTKSGFIDSIMDGKGALLNNQTDRTVEEEEEGLFDNPVAVLSGSQYALKKNQAERELRKYLGKKAQWEADQVYIANALRYNKSAVASSKEGISSEEKKLAKIRSMFPDGEVKSITVEGVVIDMTKDDGAKKLGEAIKEKINDPINATVKKLRENQIYNDESQQYTIELDGHAVNFTVSIYRTSEWDGGKMKTVIHKGTQYSSPDLESDSMMSARSVRDYLDEITDQVITGRDSQDRIDAYKARIERINAETEQMRQREGQPFQYAKELEDARKNVEEYTVLMKKEMEEKEAKYAQQQKEAEANGTTFDLGKAEDNSEDDDDVLRRSDEDYDDKVYSQAFKDYFGDWENDPGNASKVVDENGMPQILHHGTNLSAVNGGNPFWIFRPGSHFGTQGQADERVKFGSGTDQKKIYNVYLNIRNPKRVRDVPLEWLEDEDGTHSEWWEKQIERAKYQGYDGLVYLNEYEDTDHPADSWIAFYPEQIKSADENIGTYDRTNPDIRYRGAELFEEGQTFPINMSHTYSSYDVTGRRASYSTDLLPDEFPTIQSMLDAIRNQYPEYYVAIEDGQVRMQSWGNVMSDVSNARTKAKGKESYVNRKTRQAIDAVEQMAQKMNLDVEILTSTEGLTGRNARSKGFFNKRTHKITIVLPNHRTVSDVINTLLHEGVAHYGLRKMFGSNFDTFVDNVYNNVDPEIRARIDAAMKRNGWNRHVATEEYLARLAERTDFEHAQQSGWWTKIKNFFLDMLAKAGFSTSLSDNELRYILWRSYDNLLHPGDRRNIFDTAREIRMESRLGVGRYERERQRLQRTGRVDTSKIIAAEKVSEADEYSDADLLHSIRTKEPPKKTGIGYKVFVLKNGQLYPPMVANPGGEGTPVGVWLDADAAPVSGTSKTGRPQVKAGGKGTQGGSGQLAYRPGWHLGEIPYALQFNRKDGNGERTLFPNNFVWAEVEYADDVDYNDEARQEGTNASGKYQHSLAGLKHVPVDGSYKYRTNPDPRTDPWIITGAMRVNRILSREEVNDLVRKAGREPQQMQEGDVLDQESVDALNAEIKAMKEADEIGLLYRSDDDWDDESGDVMVEPFEDSVDIARAIYEKAAASDALKFQESWQDKMAGLKILQNAIEKETGHKATGAEDAYLYENRMHGKAKNQSENYDRRYYQPVLKAADGMMKAKGWTDIRQLTDYMVAKHGLERNIFYAFKEAVTGMVRDTINKEQRKLSKRYERGEIDALTYKKEQKELEERLDKDVASKIMEVHNDQRHIDNKADYEAGRKTYSQYIAEEEDIRRDYAPDFDDHYKDYSGLTELTGEDSNYTTEALAMVDDAELNAHDEERILWDAVNAATKETLRFAYESGTMSRNTYNNVRAMFDYYIPLRGWEEDNADDFYEYVSERNVFSTAVKKAYGRKSLAENPIAYIGNMAVSTLLAGHRNLLKQHFLNYVMNNPTSLVSVSEKWWENKGTETSPYWVEVAPEIPANATADEIADIVEAFNEDMKQKAEQGKATTRRGSLQIAYHATGAEKNEHVVEVQRAGKAYQLYINGNPKAAQALNGINEKAVSRISQTDFGKLIEKINRSMAAFFTSKNPAFVLSNLSRDLTMAGASVAVKEDAAYNRRFIANVFKVLRPRIGKASRYNIYGRMTGGQSVTGLLPSLMRKYLDGDLDLSNETERLFGEFMDEGAETGFVNMLSVDSFKEKMQKEIARMQGTTLNIVKAKNGTKETPVGKGLRMMGDIFEFYNRCAEDATRFIVYMTSRQMGKSLEDSIADAKDVTLNFNRKGTGAQWNAVVRDLFIFVNPAIQALSNMFKMAYKHPLKMTAVTAAFMAGGAMMPVINQWLLNLFGDDDDKDAYWNLPAWVRKNNLVMWVPGTKNFVTIPLAQEFRVFYGLGEMAASLTYDHPVHEWPMEILSSFMDLIPINPTGNGGNLAVDLTPTTLQPLMQLHDNVDFTGKPIWKENQGNKYAPMYTKAYITTPEWMISLSEAVNDVTGGNEGRKGWVEENLYGGDYINNPAVWNHLMQGYFGGMYNTIAKGFDVITTGAKGELPKIYQTPVVNRFLNRPVERDNAGVLGEEYYKLTEERDRLRYELRTWQKKAADGEEGAQDRVDEIMESDDYQRMLVIDHYDKIMKDLKAGEKAAATDADKADIKESITMYKAEMLEELAAIDGGEDPLAAAKRKFDEAKTFAEKNRLRVRIERLTGRDVKARKGDGRNDEVRKALSYREDDDRESRKVNEQYLELATAENIADDARIRAARLRIKAVTDEVKRLQREGRAEEAIRYQKQHSREINTGDLIESMTRTMNSNKKFLGKGHDEAIMKLIDANRKRMLKAIDDLE